MWAADDCALASIEFHGIAFWTGTFLYSFLYFHLFILQLGCIDRKLDMT